MQTSIQAQQRHATKRLVLTPIRCEDSQEKAHQARGLSPLLYETSAKNDITLSTKTSSLPVHSVVKASARGSLPLENPSSNLSSIPDVSVTEESLTPMQIAEMYGFERHHQIRSCPLI